METFLAPLITAIITAATAVFLLRDQRRKLGAEADSLIVGAAGQVVKSLQAEVERLCSKIEELEAEQHANRAEIEQLQAGQIRLTSENRILRARVDTLEQENTHLRAENERLRGPR